MLEGRFNDCETATLSTIVGRQALLAGLAAPKRSSKNCGSDRGKNLKEKIRVVRAGCLDVCAFGPNRMIWPEGLWYMKVTKEDVAQIVEPYIKLEVADQAKEAKAAAR